MLVSSSRLRDVEADLVERAHQRLGVVHAHARAGRRESSVHQRRADVVVGEHGRRHPHRRCRLRWRTRGRTGRCGPATPTHKGPIDTGSSPRCQVGERRPTAPAASTSMTSAVTCPSDGWIATIGASSTSARRSNSERNSRNSNSRFTSPRSGGCTPSAAMFAEVDVDGRVASQHHHLGVLAHPRLVAPRGSRGASGVCLSRLAKMPSSPP